MLDFTTPAMAAQKSLLVEFQPDIMRKLVARIVASDFGIDPAALAATTRGSPDIAFARQVAMYLTHIIFALNFAAVGRVFGRDRTTVAHACRRIEDRRDDASFDRRLILLEASCHAAVTGYSK